MPSPLDVQALAKSIHELLVLASVQRGPKHGYQIALDLDEQSDGLFVLTHGTLYPILHRLEADGALKGSWSRGGGRRRKAYRITEAGQAKLNQDAERCDLVLQTLLRFVREDHDHASKADQPDRRRA